MKPRILYQYNSACSNPSPRRKKWMPAGNAISKHLKQKMFSSDYAP
jgi:hypothetical protein